MSESPYIKIQNFRCFKQLEVKGFKRVNLIGGKNNAGKTSLLEALLIYFYPFLEGFIELKTIRKGSLEISQKSPKDAWKNFFYNQNMENSISINGCFKDCELSVKISASPSLKTKIFDNDRIYINENTRQLINSLQNEAVSTLEIEHIINNGEASHGGIVIHKKGCMANFDSDSEFSIPFINSNFPMSSEKLAQKYDKVDYEMKGDKVLNILKIFDPSIIEIKTYSFIKPTLYIQTKNQPQGLPINLFGDAIYRVTTMVVELLNSEEDFLFIDEVENGIHYTSQQTFWEGLFTLAEELDTLIFATTHSLEMIKAFTETGKKFPDQGAYFELAYSPRTDNIVAINRNIDLLEYALEHGKAIRGE